MLLWNFIVGASLKAHATSRRAAADHELAFSLDVGGAGEKRLYNYDKLNSCAARTDPLLKCGFLRAESLILLFSVGIYIYICVCMLSLSAVLIEGRKIRPAGGAAWRRKCKVLRRTQSVCVHLFYFYWARWRNCKSYSQRPAKNKTFLLFYGQSVRA